MQVASAQNYQNKIIYQNKIQNYQTDESTRVTQVTVHCSETGKGMKQSHMSMCMYWSMV